jgi:hypothetical protein
MRESDHVERGEIGRKLEEMTEARLVVEAKRKATRKKRRDRDG